MQIQSIALIIALFTVSLYLLHFPECIEDISGALSALWGRGGEWGMFALSQSLSSKHLLHLHQQIVFFLVFFFNQSKHLLIDSINESTAHSFLS